MSHVEETMKEAEKICENQQKQNKTGLEKTNVSRIKTDGNL